MSLYGSQETLFDCTSAPLLGFINRLKTRVAKMSWDHMFLIPDANGNPRNLLEVSGDIEVETVRAHVATYSGTPTRLAQNDAMLFQALYESLTQEGRNKIGKRGEEYTVNGKPSGVMLFKYILKASSVHTRATNTMLQQQITALPQYMKTVDYNIEKFHEHATSIQADLAQRAIDAPHLTHHLFQAYREVKNDDFKTWYRHQQDLYDDGTDNNAANMDPATLMDAAENKYKTLVEKGEWTTTGLADHILALEAKLVQVNKKKPSTKQQPKGKSNNKKGGKKKDPNPKGEKPAKPDWMTMPPTAAEEGKSKTVDNKEYWWCTALKCWCRHHPKDCRANKAKQVQSKNKTKNNGDKNKKTKFARALTAALADSDDDSSSHHDE